MGHSEMLLAVAGIRDEELKRRTKRLASGDWSGFDPAERLAFGFAYKLTRAPASVSPADVDELVRVFGRERAADLIWYVAWGNYMTRVADAFQLPLERENVFAPPPKKP
jgi:alkylhydroperoxidase family enzyme